MITKKDFADLPLQVLQLQSVVSDRKSNWTVKYQTASNQTISFEISESPFEQNKWSLWYSYDWLETEQELIDASRIYLKMKQLFNEQPQHRIRLLMNQMNPLEEISQFACIRFDGYEERLSAAFWKNAKQPILKAYQAIIGSIEPTEEFFVTSLTVVGKEGDLLKETLLDCGIIKAASKSKQADFSQMLHFEDEHLAYNTDKVFEFIRSLQDLGITAVKIT